MKVGTVLFIRGGKRISISRYGSCETSRIDDPEGVEQHLEAPISLMGIGQKKKNLRQTTGYAMCSFWVLTGGDGGMPFMYTTPCTP